MARYGFDPWGGRQLVSGQFLSTFGYSRLHAEASQDLSLSFVRAYSSQLGRWLSEDPLVGGPRAGDGPNLYWYARDNPIRYIDPLGLD